MLILFIGAIGYLIAGPKGVAWSIIGAYGLIFLLGLMGV